jgi:hypothetical protein
VRQDQHGIHYILYSVFDGMDSASSFFSQIIDSYNRRRSAELRHKRNAMYSKESVFIALSAAMACCQGSHFGRTNRQNKPLSGAHSTIV